MKNQKETIGWGSTQITYEIMTDSKGEQWSVPTTIDGKPCEYLKKYDPSSMVGCVTERFEPAE